MTPSSVHDIRNLALLGQAGAGKTTLLETLLVEVADVVNRARRHDAFPPW